MSQKTKDILIAIFGSLFYLIVFALPMVLLFAGYFFAEVEVNTDVSKYSDFIGKNAKEEYRNKWDMDESIFPAFISGEVLDYKMVYYNPWDAQYLSYLIIKYDDIDYNSEINRLKDYNSTEYNYYGAYGFNYELLAMYADSYQGFVYALDMGDNTIVYAELIFCNYFYDLDYKEYISEDILPLGFDATINNEYKKHND